MIDLIESPMLLPSATRPPGGNQRKINENRIIARMPAQKLGMDNHRLWTVEMNHSSLPRTWVALKMPTGIAIEMEMAIATRVSWMVAGARAWSSLMMG